jgi:hypothetical protein
MRGVSYRLGRLAVASQETPTHDAARRLLEDTSQPLQRIASSCGFGDVNTMRRTFVKSIGVSPKRISKAISAPKPSSATADRIGVPEATTSSSEREPFAAQGFEQSPIVSLRRATHTARSGLRPTCDLSDRAGVASDRYSVMPGAISLTSSAHFAPCHIHMR